MSETGRIRFDQAALENHAKEYCQKELILSRELVETLHTVASYAPVKYSAQIRRIKNDADRMTLYFSKMIEALNKAGQMVDAYSMTEHEQLQDTDRLIKALLK